MSEHQPFLFTRGGNDSLLFCKAESLLTLRFKNEYQIMPWMIHFREGDEEQRVSLPESLPQGRVVIECNPHLQQEEGGLRLIYSAGCMEHDTAPIRYSLMTCLLDQTLVPDEMPVSLHPCFTGTVVNDIIISAKKTAEGDLLMIGNDPYRIGNMGAIYRISTVFDMLGKVVITGGDESSPHSYLLDMDTLTFREILNDSGNPVYKCSILGDNLIYAVKGIGEHRYLETSGYTLGQLETLT